MTDFEVYWKSIIKEDQRDGYCNMPNPVDQYLFANGWNIFFHGGIVPERWWRKDGKNPICVRNNEMCGCYQLPTKTESIESVVKYWSGDTKELPTGINLLNG